MCKRNCVSACILDVFNEVKVRKKKSRKKIKSMLPLSYSVGFDRSSICTLEVFDPFEHPVNVGPLLRVRHHDGAQERLESFRVAVTEPTVQILLLGLPLHWANINFFIMNLLVK